MRPFPLAPFLLALLGCFSLLAARADGLKTIDSPGGGQIVFGPIDNETTLEGGMGMVLKNVHTHFGDRPQIGKFFQTAQRDSVATFFTLTAKTQGGKPITGMVIVSMPAGAKPAAAVLYDDADRFGKNFNVLLKTLNDAWHAEAVKSSGTSRAQANAPVRPKPVPPLHQVTFPDNSGTIGLPDGWQLTGSGAGAAHVAGPHGEELHLGVMFQNIYDPRNPKTRGMVDYLNRARVPYELCPYGQDLVQSWLTILQQVHQRDHTPMPSFTASGGDQVQPNQYESAAVLVEGEFDAHDGKGPMASSVRLGALKSNGEMWALNLTRESVPVQYAEEQWPTVVAIANSYRQNGAELQRQANVIIANIHAKAAADQARADAFSAANDRHNAAVEAQWDDNAKYNKSFENYQLDRTVIQENTTGGHATTGYSLADALVRNAPNQFQYVPTQDLLKGVDY